jgi:hypothetical protein
LFLLFHLLEEPLSLLLLLAALALLIGQVLTIEESATADVRSLTWVLIVDRLTGSLHILYLFKFYLILQNCLIDLGVLGFWGDRKSVV